MFKTCLYHQTHVLHFHFWRKILSYYFGENLMTFNNPLWPFIPFVSLSLMQQKSTFSLVEGRSKVKLLSKMHLPTTETQWWTPPRNYFNWINVGYGNISSNGSYPCSSFNTLYEILHRGFLFSLTLFNATYWANLIL